MKIRRSIFYSIVAFIMAFTALFGLGCNTNKTPDDEQTLEVYVYEQGYGYEWAEGVKEAFMEQDWVQQKYPELNIVVKSNTLHTFVESQMGLGEGRNTFDLMFGAKLWALNGKSDVLNLTECVYNAKIPGEDITFAEKMINSERENYVYNDPNADEIIDEYYLVPWQGGMAGILYSEELLEYTTGSKVAPRTSDELFEVCEKFNKKYPQNEKKEREKYVFIQSKEATNYWTALFNTFWGQYDGIKGYNNFYNGIDDAGMISNGIFQRKGRLKALEEYARFALDSNDFIHPDSFNKTFMINQSLFLEGEALFHIGGDWFEDEMKETREELQRLNKPIQTIKIMRWPVTSSVIELCGGIIADDNELRALVSAIDAGNTALKGDGYEVTQSVYDKIKEARFTTCGTSGVCGLIPEYATAKNVAIDYLLFLASDKGLDAYAKHSSGAMLNFKYDMKEKNPTLFNSLPKVQQERLEYFNSDVCEINILRIAESFPLVKYSGLSAFENMAFWANFTADDDKVPMSPKDYFDDTIRQWSVDKFNTAVQDAGIA